MFAPPRPPASSSISSAKARLAGSLWTQIRSPRRDVGRIDVGGKNITSELSSRGILGPSFVSRVMEEDSTVVLFVGSESSQIVNLLFL